MHDWAVFGRRELGLWPERSGAGERPAVLPETLAAPSGEEAEPACPPVPVGCWGNFAARSGGSALDMDGRSEFTPVYRTAQQGNGRVGGGGRPTLGPAHRALPGKAPLRALSELQLRSSVYRRVINILRNVPPLRPCDWLQRPPWNVLISVLRSHWGTACMGAGLARGRAPVCVSAACYSLCGRGPGGGRRRVDLNVFGSPVLWPRIGSCLCWGGPLSRLLLFDWLPPVISALSVVDSQRPRGGAERSRRVS